MTGLNCTIILLTAFLAVFCESHFNVLRNLLGAQVDLLPALLVYTGLTTNVVIIALVSVFGGLWFDSLSANPLGVSVLPLFLVGYLVHINQDLVLRDELYAQACIGFFASALAPLLTLLLLLSMGKTPLVGWGTLWQWAVLSFGGAAFAPLFFQLFDRINRAFHYQPLPETSFRNDRQIKRGRA